MPRVLIINGSSDPNGYWNNEVRGQTLLLLTHRSGAKHLAEAWARKEPMYWYRNGGDIFGPLTLVNWNREKGFFRLHFGNIGMRARPLRDETAEAGRRVHEEMKKMRHFVICDAGRVDYVNMEHPIPSTNHPSPEEVESALRAAAVPSV
jgi:hypothetical protein